LEATRAVTSGAELMLGPLHGGASCSLPSPRSLPPAASALSTAVQAQVCSRPLLLQWQHILTEGKADT